MGIADIRTAFIEGAAGRLRCTEARMRYGDDNSQILEFDGHLNDGAPFALVSDPIPAQTDLGEAARAMAEKFVADKA